METLCLLKDICKWILSTKHYLIIKENGINNNKEEIRDQEVCFMLR